MILKKITLWTYNNSEIILMREVSKYGVISGPYFDIFQAEVKHGVRYVMIYTWHDIKKSKHAEQLFSVLLLYFFVISQHTIWKRAWNE